MKHNAGTPIPAPGQGKRGEQGYVGYLLRQASGTVRAAIEHALEDLDVTQPQFMVMTLVNAYPGSSGADIARLAMLTPQTVSLIVANLERDGRLIRSISPGHARVQQMQLTETGKTLLAGCRKRTHQIEARLTASMPPEHEPIIRRWLAGIASLDLSIDADPTTDSTNDPESM
jgi:DNA-binding MarR family transcriptional regulator